MYELIGKMSLHDSHCTSSMLHSNGLPHSTNGLGSGSYVRSPTVWIGTTLISSVATFFCA